jgi:hypothetical protein
MARTSRVSRFGRAGRHVFTSLHNARSEMSMRSRNKFD